MLLAYEEMLKSNNYHNSDKYQAPLVGCLLLFSNGNYKTAHRDESAEYKHAENILFNRCADCYDRYAFVVSNK